MNHQNSLQTIGKEAYALLTQFYEYDRNASLDVKACDREENAIAIREKIVFRGVREGLVPGFIAIPAFQPPPYPCVLLVHGLGASKEDWWREGSDEARLAKELLSMGVSVFALDVQYHGERTHNSSYESAWSMDLVFFDSGHKLPSEFIPKAVDWFRRYLVSVSNKAA